METMKEKFLGELMKIGLSLNDSKQVLSNTSTILGERDIDWNSPVDGYPSIVHQTTWSWIKVCALGWVNQNCPQVYFRKMFE